MRNGSDQVSGFAEVLCHGELAFGAGAFHRRFIQIANEEIRALSNLSAVESDEPGKDGLVKEEIGMF